MHILAKKDYAKMIVGVFPRLLYSRKKHYIIKLKKFQDFF